MQWFGQDGPSLKRPSPCQTGRAPFEGEAACNKPCGAKSRCRLPAWLPARLRWPNLNPSNVQDVVAVFLLILNTQLYWDERAVSEGAMTMNKLDRPREIIEYCLKPLALSPTTEEYKEVYRRLEHVIKTLQVMAARDKRPVAIDFSNMKTININEAAHGDDA
jgi:hypothetical protein